MKERKYLLLAILFFFSSSCKKKEIAADLLIRNGLIYTGTSTQPIEGVIAVKGDKILYVGKETHADRDLRKRDKSHNLPL